MPFSIVRTLVTGMVSWAVLGVGIYLAYEAYQGLVPVDDKITVVSVPKSLPDEQNPNRLDESDSQVVVVRKEQKGWKPWAELAGALFCLGFSVGGRLPVRLLFGNNHAKVENGQQATSAFAGLGKSRGPSNHDHSLEKLANDLNAVLEHVAPNGPVILIGHSIGGMTQQTFCRLYAEKLGKSVKGLVLLHTTYTNPVATNIAAWIAVPLEPIIKVLNFSTIPLAPLLWLSNWQSYFNGSLHVSARLESFTGKQTWGQLDHSAMMGAKAWPSVVARGNFGMMKFDEERTLPKINTPVLVISGEHDRLTVQSASKHIESLLPHATAFCDHGGHLGQWEHSESVNDAILRFAGKVFEHSSTVVPVPVLSQRSGRNSLGVH